MTALRWFARGRCLARDEDSDEHFLVAGAVPGERLVVERVQREHDRVAWVAQVDEPSPDRVVPNCPHAGRCAGCELLHVSPAAEQRYKALLCAEVLARFAEVHVEPDAIEHIGSPERGDHRVRASMAVHRDADGTLRVGLRDLLGAPSHIPDCPASSPPIRSALMRLVERLPLDATLGDDAGVEVVQGVEGVAMTLRGIALDAVDPSVLATELGVGALAVREGEGVRLLFGAWPRQLPIGDLALDVAVDAWVQPSPPRAAAVYDWVERNAGHAGRRVLDATCGTGGLALRLARDAAAVLGIDANIDAIRSAERSAGIALTANIHFRGGKFETVGPRLVRDGERFDVAIVNPMRRSLGPRAMGALAELGVSRVVYLGPAPRAAAADLADLVAAGFVVTRVAAANLHPGTAQVMMCVVLERRVSPS